MLKYKTLAKRGIHFERDLTEAYFYNTRTTQTIMNGALDENKNPKLLNYINEKNNNIRN